MRSERRSRRLGQSAAPISTQPDACQSNNLRAQLRRRRDAARRLIPLDCGCTDPWPCRCTQPPLSDRMIDAGRDAALHVLDTGQIPLLELEVLQALYRRGGMDRALAEMLHAAAGGEIR
jgi:hypothetical protein